MFSDVGENFNHVTLSCTGTGMVTRSMKRGESVTLVLSEANRDPDHFGGNAKSRIVSRRFDPLREGDSSRLYYDATTQTIQTQENTFLLDMARVVVDAFLPSVSQQSAGNEKRSHFHKTFSSHIESEEKWVKLHLHAYTLLLGSALAILVGMFARHLIPSSRKLPDVIVFRTILYAFVLANVLYAISVLANAPALCDHGIVFLSFST